MSLKPPTRVINFPGDDPAGQYEGERQRLAQALPPRSIIWCALTVYSKPDFTPKYYWVPMRMARNQRKLVLLYSEE